MSDTLTLYVTTLHPKVLNCIKGTAKLVLTGEGSVMLTPEGARIGNDPADVTLSASEKVFRAIMDGTQNPIMAVMSGKLKVDGSQMRALKVSEIMTS